MYGHFSQVDFLSIAFDISVRPRSESQFGNFKVYSGFNYCCVLINLSLILYRHCYWFASSAQCIFTDIMEWINIDYDNLITVVPSFYFIIQCFCGAGWLNSCRSLRAA